MPRLEAYEPILTRWFEYEEQGYIRGGFSSEVEFEPNQVPFQFSQSFQLRNNNDGDWHLGLLPGDSVLLHVQGLMVSRGTEHPELAYELANYLSQQPVVVNSLFSEYPARRSLVGVESDSPVFIIGGIGEEDRALLDIAIENAISPSAAFFQDYLGQAINELRSNDNPPPMAEALRINQELAMEHLADSAEPEPIFVATPVPTPVLSSDETVLEVGVLALTGSLPNREAWNRFNEEFAANDPEVGFVHLNSNVTGVEPAIGASLVFVFRRKSDLC